MFIQVCCNNLFQTESHKVLMFVLTHVLEYIKMAHSGNVAEGEKCFLCSVLGLTCFVYDVSHLKTTDGTRFVFVVTCEDQLQTQTD